MLAVSLGESEGSIIRYLTELQESRLIEPSRGNANKEDVRIFFPRHPWITEYAEPVRDPFASVSVNASTESQPQLFAVGADSSHAAGRQALVDKKSIPSSRSKRRKRWFGRPRSRHSLETCLCFISYQKEVLGRRNIYDPEGLAESIFHTGTQDDELDD